MNKEVIESEKIVNQTFQNDVYQSIYYNDCHFQNCIFESCEWSNCQWLNCQFTDCKFVQFKSTDSQMKQSFFKNCELIGIDWFTLLPKGVFQYPIEAFESCLLKYCVFTVLDLSNYQFSGNRMLACQFTECDLTKSSFKNCELKQTLFTHCNLSHADFTDAKGYEINPLINKLQAARFSKPEVYRLIEYLPIQITEETSST